MDIKTLPVFGIISWFPDKEPNRTQRINRLNKMLNQLIELFGDDIHFMIIAQNWKDYKIPSNIKNITIFKYNKLGILGARKTLGKHFLESPYNYLIMCDDDIILKTSPTFSKEYFFEELNKHPRGFVFLNYKWSLTFCAISKWIYKDCPMIDIDPEKNEGYEDTTYSYLLHYKHMDKEFSLKGIEFVQHRKVYRSNLKSTWRGNKSDSITLDEFTKFYIRRFKQGLFKIDDNLKRKAKNLCFVFIYLRKLKRLNKK